MSENNTLNIADLHNLAVLARKGIASIGENIKPEHATACWKAIAAAEKQLERFKIENQKSSLEVEEINPSENGSEEVE